jgi:hypothetical protein
MTNEDAQAKAEEEEKKQRLAREEEAEKATRLTDKEFGKQMQTVRSVSKKPSKKRKVEAEGPIAKKTKASTGFIRPE